MKLGIVTMVTLAALSAGAADRIGDWWVAMPTEVFKSLGMSERTCAERAAKAFDERNYKTAANEWKRFESEFVASVSEEAAAWALFFNAYCLDRAKDKFKAMDLYADVMELYPDSPAACAALFFRAQAEADNGQDQKALASYQELLDNPAFATHPLAYAAHNRLAWSHLGNAKLKEAMSEWQAVVDLKPEANRNQWETARNYLSMVESLADPLAKSVAVAGGEDVKPEKRCEDLRRWRAWVWDEVWWDRPVVKAYFQNRLGKAKDLRSAELDYLKKFASAFSKTAKPIFESCGRGWEMMMYDFDTVSALAPKNVGKVIDRVGGEVRKCADPETRSERAVQFIERLRRAEHTTEAKLFLDLIQDPVKRGRTGADIGWTAKDGKFVAQSLAPLEAMPDAEVSGDAKRNHARSCQELERDYDAAIKLYEDAPKPPETLWKIAECHRLAGRKPQAQATLDEICGVFPKDAAAAMLRKGDWFEADGDKKNAIACWRRILAHQDWKKADAASGAHQRLERYGIATGGAVLNEVH